tara:strand:+ start:1291 stop:1710 length:420 start_codon:yes stop_codon:yes gene_type:complete
MAAGAFTFYDNSKLQIANSSYDLDSDTLIAVLATSGYTPALTQTNLTDITNECADADYVRQTITGQSITATGSTVNIDVANITYGSSVTITAKWLILFNQTVSNNLVAYVDLDTGGGSVSSSNSTFSIDIATAGIATLT